MAKKPCFVIAPIGDEKSETRKRSDLVLKHVIRPAVEECGYEATRADEIAEPGMITSQVIQRIVDDPLVVADLTGRNPNVFYELAIRHAIRQPLVQLIQKNEQIPFDVAQTRTIPIDHTDLDSVEEAKREILKQIRSLEKDPTKMETPISLSIDLQRLRQSDDPEQRSFGDLVTAVTEMRTEISRLVSSSRDASTTARIASRSRLSQEEWCRILESGDWVPCPRCHRVLAADSPTCPVCEVRFAD